MERIDMVQFFEDMKLHGLDRVASDPLPEGNDITLARDEDLTVMYYEMPDIDYRMFAVYATQEWDADLSVLQDRMREVQATLEKYNDLLN